MNRSVALGVGVAIFGVAAAAFWIGVKTGRYLSGQEIENAYPWRLRPVAAANMPTCDEFNALGTASNPFKFSMVREERGEMLGRLISRVGRGDSAHVVLSIFDIRQNQFVDEVWPQCGG